MHLHWRKLYRILSKYQQGCHRVKKKKANSYAIIANASLDVGDNLQVIMLQTVDWTIVYITLNQLMSLGFSVD